MTINIILQNIIILLIFTIVYQLLFRWRKEFLLNRIYLILTVISSIIIPFLTFKVFPYTIVVHNKENTGSISFPVIETVNVDWLRIIYLVGLGFSFIYLLYRFLKIIIFIKKSSFNKKGDYLISTNSKTTFSFFKYIFLKENEDILVLSHEIVHVSKKHSYDILFHELSKCLLWFNPLVLVILYFARENHEFEADFEAMNKENIDEISMAEYILNYIENKITGRLLLTNNFFSLTKNRVIMLSKNKKTSKYIYLVIVPIFLVIFSAFTFKSYPIYETQEGLALQDTLIPGYFTQIDSVPYYDPEDNFKEHLKIIKSTESMDEYIESLKLSGKLSSRIDTIEYYDPDTKEEFLKVYKTKYPYELRFIFHKLSWEQQEAIIKEYGSMIEVKLKE